MGMGFVLPHNYVLFLSRGQVHVDVRHLRGHLHGKVLLCMGISLRLDQLCESPPAHKVTILLRDLRFGNGLRKVLKGICGLWLKAGVRLNVKLASKGLT